MANSKASELSVADLLTEEYYGIATPKDSPHLDEINKGIAVLVYVRYTRKGTALPCPYTLQYNLVPHLNGNRYIATLLSNGTYKQIYQKWFNGEPPQLPDS
ncbi:hypothetical protein [Nostoc flagelliforme]|uniref:hypothetical protein n=1 Tax=Nostoc flagelliforme TaxID=1306274 RepID=UPI001F552063|nr:hypothetical protein [Nostoc flagelliforme]